MDGPLLLGAAALVVALTGLLGGIVAGLVAVFKIWNELKLLHTTVNSLADKRVEEAKAAGVDRGSIEERERADARTETKLPAIETPVQVTIVPAVEPLPVVVKKIE